MLMAMRILHIAAVFVSFLASPMDAEVCRQDIMAATVMQCRNCTGDLKLAFSPSQPVPYYSSDQIKTISCTVNKPANISIFFEHILKPYSKKPKELTKDGKVKGITVTKLNGGCTYAIQFEEYTKSFCQYGHFTCKAVTDANETDSRTVEVSMAEEKVPMTFTVEDDALQKSKELILGTYANLSCLYKSHEWNRGPFSRPFIKFFRVDRDGVDTGIIDSHEAPPNYESQGNIVIAGIGTPFASGTRKLFLRRIDASTAATYLCRVITTHGCVLEKKLELRTRPCKKGHYCNRTSSAELPCREGTYSNITGSFSASDCRICPINCYCPSGSSSPKQCPKDDFLPAKLTRVKLYQGKEKISECRICPVDPCDKDDSKCSFICSARLHEGVLEQSFTIRCSLSNGTLLRNLEWYRGRKKIITSSSHTVSHDEKSFILKIHKLSQDDIGDYTCSGSDVIMGNHVYSTTNLVVVKEAKKNSILYWKVALLVLVPLLFSFIIGCLVRKFLRQRIHGPSIWSRKEHGIQLVSPIVSDTFLEDSKEVYGGLPCKYDVFICYNSSDKTWVTGTLLAKLRSFNLQVCIDFEDFIPGKHTIKSAAEAINSSRKTIAVLSPDFLNSALCHNELLMALSRASNEHNVIPVMYRQCKVPIFLHEVTYLDWCNKDVKQTFWEQLLRTINIGKPLQINVAEPCLEDDAAESKVDIGLRSCK